MFNIFSSRSRRLSCGVVLLTERSEILLCHVTGQRHWDLPKGGIHAGESPGQAALRETREETGLQLAEEGLLDLGRHAYTGKKDLHLFAMLSERVDPLLLHCESCFVERASGRSRPEMDGFGWFALNRIEALCTPKMASLLTTNLDLGAIVGSLCTPSAEALAA
ncbi:MAG: NUDIX hydrolase [Caldimonas sp.]